MLAIPLVLGLAAARAAAPAAWLVPPALVLVFLSRYAAVGAASRMLDGRKVAEGFFVRRTAWAAIYLGGAGVLLMAAFGLIARERLRDVLPAALATLLLGLLHTVLALTGRDRTLAGELIGMAGLASAAPLVTVVSARPLDRFALGTAFVAFLYSTSSLAYVRAIRALWKGDRKSRARCVFTHAVMAGAILTLVAGGFIPSAVALAFLPVYARTALGLAQPPPDIRALGKREIGVSAAFVVVAVAGYLLAHPAFAP
jgi:hypothetical protein